MLSKNDIKIIRLLDQSKYRKKHGLFIAEGSKVINEFIDSGFTYKKIFTLNADLFHISEVVNQLDAKSLKQISFLSHPKDALALFHLPEENDFNLKLLETEFTLLCDCVQDPGNLGTIIRIADWFGIKQIVCSRDTVDAFNPKVVQSSMGSVARVKVFYEDLIPWLNKNKSGIPIMATSLSGQNIYNLELPANGILIMGNESKGVDSALAQLANLKLFIPGSGNAESLNVAVSAGIVCAELNRVKFNLRK